jgi:hypothetical protein
MEFKETIEQIKGSVSTVNNSLKMYNNEDISDSLLISNLNHLLDASKQITAELNRRNIFNENIK